MNNAENSSDFAFLGKMGRANREVDVYRALKFLHFSELPPEIRDAKGIAIMDKTSFGCIASTGSQLMARQGLGMAKKRSLF